MGLCYNKGYMLSGTEYKVECWCGGPNIRQPQTYSDDSLNLCTFACPGDATEACGGDGGYMSMYADTTRFDIAAFLASVKNGTSTTSSSIVQSSTSSRTSKTRFTPEIDCRGLMMEL